MHSKFEIYFPKISQGKVKLKCRKYTYFINKNKYSHVFLLTPVILDKFICKACIQQDSINQIRVT